MCLYMCAQNYFKQNPVENAIHIFKSFATYYMEVLQVVMKNS